MDSLDLLLVQLITFVFTYRTLSALLNNFPNVDEDEDAARELLVTIVEKAAIHQNIAKDEADAILTEIVTPLHWLERNTLIQRAVSR